MERRAGAPPDSPNGASGSVPRVNPLGLTSVPGEVLGALRVLPTVLERPNDIA